MQETAGTKRRQRARMLWNWAPKSLEVVEAGRAGLTDGNTEKTKRRDLSRRPVSVGSTGVVEPQRAWQGSPRNLREPDSSGYRNL